MNFDNKLQKIANNFLIFYIFSLNFKIREVIVFILACSNFCEQWSCLDCLNYCFPNEYAPIQVKNLIEFSFSYFFY